MLDVSVQQTTSAENIFRFFLNRRRAKFSGYFKLLIYDQGISAVLSFPRIDISYAQFFFLRKRGKSTIICPFKLRGFNYFYMSLGQVRHTIVVSRYQNHRKDNEIQLKRFRSPGVEFNICCPLLTNGEMEVMAGLSTFFFILFMIVF